MIRLFCLCLSLLFAMPAAANSSAAATLADLWVGTYDNRVQIDANRSLTDALPGRMETLRDVTVRRVPDSPLGPNVILLEERKAGEATVHRQRLHRLVEEPVSGTIRVQQLFFKDGPVYDRPVAPLDSFSSVTEADVDHVARCDLFVRRTERGFEGRMIPRECRYEHPRGGEVWAEFEMVLNDDGYAYRDRSVLVESGVFKGEIEDFGWLRFDRLSPGELDPMLFPSLSRQLGVWEGEFLRVGPDGAVLDRFPTRIEAKLLPDGTYSQSNRYNPDTPQEREIVSTGRVEGASLLFENDRVSGRAWDVDETTSVFSFTLSNGTEVREVISLIPDGADGPVRYRATQYLNDGQLLRRTLITERKTG